MYLLILKDTETTWMHRAASSSIPLHAKEEQHRCPPFPWEPCGRRVGKSLRARGDGGHQGNRSSNQQDGCTCEFTETDAACTGPARVRMDAHVSSQRQTHRTCIGQDGCTCEFTETDAACTGPAWVRVDAHVSSQRQMQHAQDLHGSTPDGVLELKVGTYTIQNPEAIFN
ncbi:hypothetical protein LEMLEM_LOCUS11468 [Lemmus lemmus]